MLLRNAFDLLKKLYKKFIIIIAPQAREPTADLGEHTVVKALRKRVGKLW